MPLLAKSQSGTVTGLWGQAFIEMPDGTFKPLHIGDKVHWADQLLTTQDGIVQITRPDGEVVAVQPDDVDRDIAAVDQGEIDIAPAAGLAGGGEGGLTPGLRVDRVSESVSPLSYAFDAPRALPATLVPGVQQPFLADDLGNPPGSTADNTAPTVTATSGAVSESGLPGGVTDPNAPYAEPTVFVGRIDVTDPDGDATTLALRGPVGVQTADGRDVVWRADGGGGLVGEAGGTTVATLTVDGGGQYTFTLLQPLRHGGAGEDSLTLTFGVSASDGRGGSGTGEFTVTVRDDIPTQLIPVHDAVLLQDTNVLIALDVSGSMDKDSGIDGMTRLQAAVKSLETLLDQYGQFGHVAVRLVTFSDTAQALGTGWVDAGEAKTLLAGLAAEGGTNYDLALSALQAAFGGEGKIEGAQNVAYFLSDGDPTLSDVFPISIAHGGNNDGTATNPELGDGIDAGEASAWTAFLQANHITAHAIGLGDGVHQVNLDPIAHDGALATGLDATVVTDFGQLASVLSGTVKQSANGSLVQGQLLGADGWGHVASVTVDGVVHTYDAAHPVMTFTTALGQALTLDFNSGAYTYAVASPLSADAREVFAYSLADKDGDVAGASLVIDVNHTTVLQGGPAGDVLQAEGPGTHIMLGEAGDDVLTGGPGADQLFGHAGHDTLIGGAGSDMLDGGAGSDVFRWTLGDAVPGAASGPVDTIRDFDARAVGEGGDVLDLRDLLVGEDGAAGAISLTDYIGIETRGADTVLHVSSTGGLGGGAATSGANQQIVLEGVHLAVGLGLPAEASTAQIIGEMIGHGKLLVDSA